MYAYLHNNIFTSVLYLHTQLFIFYSLTYLGSAFNFAIEDAQVFNMVEALFSLVHYRNDLKHKPILLRDAPGRPSHYLVLQQVLKNVLGLFSTSYFHPVDRQAQNTKI